MKNKPHSIAHIVKYHRKQSGLTQLELADLAGVGRKQSGLTQLELADLAGVGKTVIFDIEKGKTTVKFETLIKVLTSLNIRINFESPLMQIYTEKNK